MYINAKMKDIREVYYKARDPKLSIRLLMLSDLHKLEQ